MILFNVVWFVFIGWWQALSFLFFAALFSITVIGLPIGKSLFNFAKLCAFPFGKEIIQETELKGETNVSEARKIGGLILNIVWLPFGVFFALTFIVAGIVSFITIFGIPVGVVYCKSARFIIFPIGAKVVSKKQAYASAVANELEKRGHKVSINDSASNENNQ